MYQLPNLNPQYQQIPNYQKIVQYFFHKLPNNFLLTNHLIFGECLIQINQKSLSLSILQKQKNDKIIINPKRLHARYITNKQQILIILINQDGFSFNTKINKNTCLRILFSDIIGIKLSVWYCGIMILYTEYDNCNDDQNKRIKSVIIQDIDIGGNNNQYFRQHIVKYANNTTGNINMGEHYMCTLLDYQIYKQNQKKDKQKNIINNNKNIKIDKHISQGQLKRTKNINLKKYIQQIHKQFGTKQITPKNLNKKFTSQTNLLSIYTIYAQLSKQPSKQNIKQYKIYICIAQTNRKYAPIQSNKLCRIKVIPSKYLIQHHQLFYQLYNQCQYSKDYQIITPYIPVLNRVYECGKLLVMEYKYYEGYTIRQLIKKQKISRDKKYLRDFLAEIVVAIGHIHQCGFVCRNIGIDTIIVNYDGHVMLENIGMMNKCSNINKNNNNTIRMFINQRNQQLANQLNQKQIQFSNIKSKLQKKLLMKKQMKNMSPQQLENMQQYDYISDWWQLGLLIHQIITGSHIFENYSPQIIHKILTTNMQQQLNFTLLNQILLKNPQLENIVNLTKNLLIKDKTKRLGSLNDYHIVLSSIYFKGIDKKKLTKRQGQPIMKIKQSKIHKEINDIQFKQQNIKQIEMRQNIMVFQDFLKECSFDRDFQFGD